MAEYIEREAAYALSRIICDAIRNREYHPATFGHLILDWIDDLPAADVAPVKHGRWKIEENWETGYGVYVHVCTACNAITPVNVSRYKYCPNCGAKMEAEE